jgi:hypothetical protein
MFIVHSTASVICGQGLKSILSRWFNGIQEYRRHMHYILQKKMEKAARNLQDYSLESFLL